MEGVQEGVSGKPAFLCCRNSSLEPAHIKGPHAEGSKSYGDDTQALCEGKEEGGRAESVRGELSTASFARAISTSTLQSLHRELEELSTFQKSVRYGVKWTHMRTANKIMAL